MRSKTILLIEICFGAVLLLSSIFVLVVMFTRTPSELGPAMLAFWFIAILLFTASTASLIDFNWKIRNEDNRLKPNKMLSTSLRTGILLGFSLTILLALSSLGSLSLRDIILFGLTVLLIELYFRTRKSQ